MVEVAVADVEVLCDFGVSAICRASQECAREREREVRAFYRLVEEEEEEEAEEEEEEQNKKIRRRSK